MREEISYLKANLRGADDVRVKTLTDDVSALKQELEYTWRTGCSPHPTPEKINSTAMTLRSGTTCVSTMKKDEKYAGAYCMECAGTIDWDITESEFDDDSELHLCTACERENERLGFVGARQHAMETQQPVGIDDPLSNGEDFHTRMSRDDADEVAKYRDQPHYSPVDDQEDAGSMY